MTLRIAIGGFLHESHSFAPRSTGWADFAVAGGFPALTRGAAMLDVVRGISAGIAGAMEVAAEHGASLAPLAWCAANPAGPVETEAFERISAIICSQLSDALDGGAIDGVYLDLHGAMLAVGFDDAEGELLRRIRAIVGDTPVTISLDPHCNFTAAMVARSDVAVPYRTYPHVDMKQAGAQAMRLLIERIKRGAPFFKAYRQLDYWIPLPNQCTMIEPMQGVLMQRAAIAEQFAAAELAFCFGFPYADFPDCGVALAAYAPTQDAADQAADAFLRVLQQKEHEFRLDVLPADEAVAKALSLSGGNGPVVIADTQDNPGGGGHGDTTGLLAALVAQGAKGAVLCLINDAESAAACVAAGVGNSVQLSLGGKSDGVPFVTDAKVLKLTDGVFTLTGPMGAGNPVALGPMALIDIAPGIRVVVISRKIQAYDQEILRHVGIEPKEQSIIVLKSSVHFRADYQPIASHVLVASAPGPVVADPSTLTFSNLRPGLRLRPGQNSRS